MDRRCPCCQTPLEAPDRGRPPVYCSTECRDALSAHRRLTSALDRVEWTEQGRVTVADWPLQFGSIAVTREG